MADGNTISGGGSYSAYNWHCYVNLYEIGRTDTTVTLRCDGGYSTRYAIDCHANGWNSVGGSWNGSVYSGSNSGWTTVNVITTDFTVARGSSAYTYTVSGGVQVTGGFGNGTSSASASVAIPQRAYYKPHRPKDFSVSYVSDTSQDLEWAGDYTGMDGGYPWTGVRIYRRANGGSWVLVATLSWGATNWRDNTTKAGNRYDYKMTAYGPGGESDSTAEISVYTTPTALGRLEAAKSGASTVKLTGTDAPAWVDSWEFERTADGGKAWAAVPVSADWEDSAAPAGTVAYRARAVKSGRKGPWRESNSVTTICPPLAPALKATASAVATGSTVALAWTPNHPDGSAQSAAQVEISTPAGPVAKTLATETSLQVSAASKGAWAWRVRTKGLDADWGAWSESASFSVADAPQAWFTAPADDSAVEASLPISVSWQTADETGVAAQSVRLLDAAGNVVYSAAPGKADRALTLGSGLGIANGASYALELTVQGGSTLRATAVRRFRTDWAQPDPASVEISYDDSCAVTVVVGNAPEPYSFAGNMLRGPMTKLEDGNLRLDRRAFVRGSKLVVDDVTPLAVRFDVVLRDCDGARTKLAEGLCDGQRVTYPLPPLGVPYGIEVESFAESGVSCVEDIPTERWDGSAMLNFGQAGEGCVRVTMDPEISASPTVSRTRYHFAGGGSDFESMLPVSYGLAEADEQASFSFAVKGVDEYRKVMAAARGHSKAWLRNPFGERLRGDVSLSAARTGPDAWKVSGTLDRTRWEEPANG